MVRVKKKFNAIPIILLLLILLSCFYDYKRIDYYNSLIKICTEDANITDVKSKRLPKIKQMPDDVYFTTYYYTKDSVTYKHRTLTFGEGTLNGPLKINPDNPKDSLSDNDMLLIFAIFVIPVVIISVSAPILFVRSVLILFSKIKEIRGWKIF